MAVPSGMTYPVWRKGAGATLLLLHGFTGSHETWHRVSDRLADGRQVVTLDLPGHAQQEILATQSFSFSTVVDDLASIIESLPGGVADVLGYSMGGRLALALAIDHPEQVRSLILESASPGIADEHERRTRQVADERLADRIVQRGLEDFVDYWEALPMWESQAVLAAEVRNRQRNIRLDHTPAGLAANLRATGTGAQPSFWEQLPHLATPTLLIAGELDEKFAQVARRMHDTVPVSRLEIVSNAGHAVHLEQSAGYVWLVSQFLNLPVHTKSPDRRSDHD